MWYNPTMRRRFRIRRIAKWTGLVLCVLVLVAWGVSTVKWVVWSRTGGTWTYESSLLYGSFHLERYPASWSPKRLQGFSIWPYFKVPPVEATAIHRLGLTLPKSHQHFSVISTPPWTGTVEIPLWIPFVLLAVPAALLWWRDRKPPRGHCQRCGYNLTGNTSGTCPECGQPI